MTRKLGLMKKHLRKRGSDEEAYAGGAPIFLHMRPISSNVECDASQSLSAPGSVIWAHVRLSFLSTFIGSSSMRASAVETHSCVAPHVIHRVTISASSRGNVPAVFGGIAHDAIMSTTARRCAKSVGKRPKS